MQGRRLLGYINECKTAARKDLGGKFVHQKPDKRGRVERPEVLVQVGERWRARDGRMWDIYRYDDTTTPPALVAHVAGDTETRWRFNRNGTSWGTFRSGPAAADLMELVIAAPKMSPAA